MVTSVDEIDAAVQFVVCRLTGKQLLKGNISLIALKNVTGSLQC